MCGTATVNSLFIVSVHGGVNSQRRPRLSVSFGVIFQVSSMKAASAFRWKLALAKATATADWYRSPNMKSAKASPPVLLELWVAFGWNVNWPRENWLPI